MEAQYIDQTEFGECGNCMSACIASMMGLAIDEVPNFFKVSSSDEEWWSKLRLWLADFNLGIITVSFDRDYLSSFKGTFIVSGKSLRGFYHAVLWKDGAMVHDPHPSRLGIIEPLEVDILYVLEPMSVKNGSNRIA